MTQQHRDNSQQLGLLQGETPTTTPSKTKCASVQIYKVALVREGRLHCYHKQIRSSADAGALLHAYLADVDREHFVVLMLDTKNKVIAISTVSIGSLNASIVHPREVFKPAILSNAASIICGHNHPSGDCQPSKEDRALTTRLVECGRLLGIQILDHVIIGSEGKYLSLADENML